MRNVFGHIPDPPEPPSDRYLEEHCPRCKHLYEWQQNGEWWAECKNPGCEFEEREDEEDGCEDIQTVGE